MATIVFIDIEVNQKNEIVDIGALHTNGNKLHDISPNALVEFVRDADFICGHNIINHDLKYIDRLVIEAGIDVSNSIDTLFLSPLLFPKRPYHRLLKDEKLNYDEENNPLNDCIKAKILFDEELTAFAALPEKLQAIYYLLLTDQIHFKAFFKYIAFQTSEDNLVELVSTLLLNKACEKVDLAKLIEHNPVELAYCISNILVDNRFSITPPWVLRNFPEVQRIFTTMRSKPCISGCEYCDEALDVHKGLKDFFGFDNFRSYAGEPLQLNATKAAVKNDSLLAVFPTGGGKSITFQLPALMSGRAVKGLTVVVSPLQSLMKDQVDNLERMNITEAVTINGLLDPIERAKSFERVENGSASLLYISPESLRSNTIKRLLLSRNVVRFVIDEAHCFSAWGQDFRVDYLYIGTFIKALQEDRQLSEPIPVSCFTATAKRKVIEDICFYFKEYLNLDLNIFSSKASRTNLTYKVLEQADEASKYNAARDLISAKDCPTIIYVSRTKKARLLAEQLSKDGFLAKPYHGKMEAQEKTANQNAFIAGEVPIMVATSAFGMGVDKKDVGMVIHYEISDSLENYVQEAGRAGRDENITADCYVLFNEEDLSKHFILLNQTKISIKEIQQIWRAIKDITRFRSSVSNSALEIARKAGWDENVVEIETRVTTAIAALEEAGYLKRGQNMPRIFANSILARTAQEAIDKIQTSANFGEKEKEDAVRIIKRLFSAKRTKEKDEAGETRIDYLSDTLGIVKEDVINVVNLLREDDILADAQDLTAFIDEGDNQNRSENILNTFVKIENFLLPIIEDEEKTFNLKALNEDVEASGCSDVSPNKIKTILNFWVIKNWIKRKPYKHDQNHMVMVSNLPKKDLAVKLENRHELAKFILQKLYKKAKIQRETVPQVGTQVLVEFSVLELKKAFEQRTTLFTLEIFAEDVEDALFYLSRIGAIKIEGGFLVVYNKLSIDRLEHNNKRQYKTEDYKKLNEFYENKVQQIHIVGEYAQKMISDYKGALQFTDDYFQLNYSSFIKKYFPGSRQNEIKKNITPAKFRQLFGDLSPAQLQIIQDNESQYMVVAAGPGSGKTKVLVHKLASLLLMEDVKHEQLLMLTFSRAATTEFKKRLHTLIGNAALYIEIQTFHGYCFELLGRVGNLDKSPDILKSTLLKLQNGDVEVSRFTKTVLVIDEAQDMDADAFALVTFLMQQNEEMRIIAVGDDDQNIYEWRGSDSKHMVSLINDKDAKKVELIENYRSANNLIEFTNAFSQSLQHRLKETPIIPRRNVEGKIEIHQYKNSNILTPLAASIASTEIIGSTCVLTTKNEEALTLVGQLLKNGMQARLIQSNDGFDLFNLVEIRYFIEALQLANDDFTIPDDKWNEAKRLTLTNYNGTKHLSNIQKLLSDFESTYPKTKRRSDFETFLNESSLDDFILAGEDMILVSTIHKAKGREFDNVFLLLQDFSPNTDAQKRLLYVAMTRAKNNLYIHLNGGYLKSYYAEDLETIVHETLHLPANEITLQLSLGDVYLSFFNTRQELIHKLKSGDALQITEDGCNTSTGLSLVKYSKSFSEELAQLRSKGFVPQTAKVNFIVHWKAEDKEVEVKVVLVELVLGL